jgi:hypothetical protein
MRKNAYKEKQTVAAESMHSKIKPNTGEKMNEYTMDPRRREITESGGDNSWMESKVTMGENDNKRTRRGSWSVENRHCRGQKRSGDWGERG